MKIEDWIWPLGTCYIICCHCAKFITSQNGIIYWNILLNKGKIWFLYQITFLSIYDIYVTLIVVWKTYNDIFNNIVWYEEQWFMHGESKALHWFTFCSLLGSFFLIVHKNRSVFPGQIESWNREFLFHILPIYFS